MDTSLNNKSEAVTDELITKQETARRLKVCVRQIELMVNRGEIPVVRLGRRAVRFNWSAVLNALESQTPVGASATVNDCI